MAFENLLKSIDESAKDRERELRERTEAAAASIMQEAKEQAAGIRQAQLDQAKKAATIERHRSLYLAKSEEKKNLIAVQEDLYGRAFALATEQLQHIRTDPKYPEIFTSLLREAVDAVGSLQYRIHIDPGDEALAKKVLADIGLKGEVVRDIRTAGGVVVTTPDNTVSAANTIESRLERIREHRKLEIHAILNGG